MPVKKIIYHCYGGAHSSVVAAAIHLGSLPPDKIPTREELLKLDLFDRQTQDGHGQLHFFGFDERGRGVFSVGARNVGQALERALTGVSKKILGQDNDLVLVDTLHCVNLRMRVGGYISRRLGLIRFGRPIVVKGTQKAFPSLVQLVEQIKSEVNA